ncbi:hypothetical protein ACIBD9_25735 [Micromonospora sp. NPDC050784]
MSVDGPLRLSGTDPETREYLASMVKVIRPVETVYETALGDDLS